MPATLLTLFVIVAQVEGVGVVSFLSGVELLLPLILACKCIS